jgi:hypothetical protein
MACWAYWYFVCENEREGRFMKNLLFLSMIYIHDCDVNWDNLSLVLFLLYICINASC